MKPAASVSQQLRRPDLAKALTGLPEAQTNPGSGTIPLRAVDSDSVHYLPDPIFLNSMNKYFYTFSASFILFLLTNCSSRWTEITVGDRPNAKVKVITNPDIEKWRPNQWVQCSGTLAVYKTNSENPLEIILPSISRPVMFMSFDQSFPKLPHNMKKYNHERAVVIGKLTQWKGSPGLLAPYFFDDIVFIQIKQQSRN